MGISPLYSIHQYSEEIYKVVAFKGVRDPANPRVRDKEHEQHYDAKLNEAFCRAKSLVLQYALCNPWDFFFTGTDNFTSARYVTVHRAFPAGTLKTHFQKMLDLLLQEHPYDEETLEGYVELMVEVCCSRRDFIRIAGEEMASGVVKSRFLKLNHEHIAYVLDSLSQNTTLVKNIKAYTLAALYNAPTTISQYYASLVSHDLSQDAAGI